MALQLGRAVRDGIERTLTATGGLLLVGLIAIQLTVQTSLNTALVALFPPGPAEELSAVVGLTLPVSGTVAGLLFAATTVLGSAYLVVLARAFTRPKGKLSAFPAELWTHRIGRATLSALLSGVVVAVAVTIGSVFLFLPGIFLAACFLFFVFAVGVEDRGPLSALRRSWGLSRGHRLKLSALVLFAGVLGVAISALRTVVDLAGSPAAGDVVSNTLFSVLYVLLYGVAAAAYLQLRDSDSGGSGGTETTESLGSVDAADD